MPATPNKAEMKKTIAVAVGGAFGFIIALIWRDIIIIGLMNMAGSTSTTSRMQRVRAWPSWPPSS